MGGLSGSPNTNEVIEPLSFIDLNPTVGSRAQSRRHGLAQIRSVQLAARRDSRRKLAKHQDEHRVKSPSPKAFGPFGFGSIWLPSTEPKVAGSSPAGCTFFRWPPRGNRRQVAATWVQRRPISSARRGLGHGIRFSQPMGALCFAATWGIPRQRAAGRGR